MWPPTGCQLLMSGVYYTCTEIHDTTGDDDYLQRPIYPPVLEKHFDSVLLFLKSNIYTRYIKMNILKKESETTNESRQSFRYVNTLNVTVAIVTNRLHT
jgi:hypothetical protein